MIFVYQYAGHKYCHYSGMLKIKFNFVGILESLQHTNSMRKPAIEKTIHVFLELQQLKDCITSAQQSSALHQYNMVIKVHLESSQKSRLSRLAIKFGDVIFNKEGFHISYSISNKESPIIHFSIGTMILKWLKM